MENEIVLNLVRNKLNNDKIKLWLSPFTEPGNDKGVYPDSLVFEFSESLNLSKSAVECALEQLRKHALHKLASRNGVVVENTEYPLGVIKVTVKVIAQGSTPKIEKIELDMTTCKTGKALKERIGYGLGCEKPSYIKLIHKGRILSDEVAITTVGIQNGSTILVMQSDKDSYAQEEAKSAWLRQIKVDAELLSTIDDPTSSHYLQVADQEGRGIELPFTERKALAVALALHEKGRSAMKNRKYDNALVLFLEADSEFKCCTSDILRTVDNYALLNLDIVWCYLCLGSISDLPDAEQRLFVCQACFHRSYGPNLERLKAVKGGFGEESALMARLHLLQSIACFHKGRFEEAKRLFDSVQSELESLKVDDEKIAQVISFGYTTAEARLALRSSHGSVESAVYRILKKREERMQIRRNEKEKEKELMNQKKLGRTVNGDWVDCNLYDQLVAMGYPCDAARQALKMSNNNVSSAVQLLHDQEEFFQENSVDQGQVAQLVSMGFDQIDVEEALKTSHGDLATAQETLVSMLALDPILPRESDARPGLLKEAVDRLTEDILEDQDDYLDLNMKEEEAFLQEYLALLQSSTNQ